MELILIEDNKNKLIVDIKGAGHALCNAIKKELWNDKDVKAAAYNVEHPLVGIPRMIVETSGKEARKAVLDAISRLKKQNTEFKKKFSSLK
jgi:DNA-directed RNA polymerase subunit L